MQTLTQPLNRFTFDYVWIFTIEIPKLLLFH